MMALVVSGLILLIYLVFRNKKALVPSNIVFLSYLMYLIFPAFLYYTLDLIDWNYILPWGKIHDWSTLSDKALIDFLYVFMLFFFITRFLEIVFDRNQDSCKNTFIVSDKSIILLSMLIFLGLLYFIHRTGGLSNWLNDYSYTYLTRKKGSGFLNFVLIHAANFLAMILGFYCFINNRKNITTVLLVVFVLILAAWLQGFKSRILVFLIFFLVIPISKSRISVIKGVMIFILFIILFSLGMYVRSNGFYNSMPMLIEYLLSYFNTIFLHDRVLSDMDGNTLSTLGFAINKWIELLGFSSSETFFDISAWLTSIYFPDQWYNESATQQWPIETELYLNFNNKLFWFSPIFLYSLYICFLCRYRNEPLMTYVYINELLIFLSLFRGTMFQWIGVFNVFMYMVFIAIGWLMIKRGDNAKY
ncbi:hypothetical protein [Vibrio penaeicida]|uniref:hypothetical protein n=1 Tax=Vibrio penaeicida TaxID=104609 RepID=UPI0011AB7279|nr:hypothetical protein [Vibrio penaeicida]